AQIVQDGGRRLLVGERFEGRERIIVFLQMNLGKAGEKPGSSSPRRGGRHRLNRLQRASMVPLVGVHVPQGQANPVEAWLNLQRAVQISNGGPRRFGEQTLHVILERRDRRVLA